MESAISLKFPNAFSLDYSYYEDERYNETRRCKLILFSTCLGDNTSFDEMAGVIGKAKRKKLIETLVIGDIEYDIACSIAGYATPFILTKEYIVKNLERGCINRTVQKANEHNIRCVWTNPKFSNLYHDTCYRVASNIDANSSINSSYIQTKILNHNVNPFKVAQMTSKELCPDKYIKIDQKINKRNNLEQKVKYSELYRCRKCKRNQCKTERRYNRSLDEGVNLMIICTFCGNEWCG
jgi:DNA-directed RNA polymerase subunit M/transcription elongation factor TFIIS